MDVPDASRSDNRALNAGGTKRPQTAGCSSPRDRFDYSRTAPLSVVLVLYLATAFALDSFGGGFVVQRFAAYWFYVRFGVDTQTLGVLFFAANVLAGVSALVASRLSNRIGLVNGRHARAVERAGDQEFLKALVRARRNACKDASI